MDDDRQLWRVWIKAIDQWGLRDWVASILDAAGPLTILGAQMVYVFEPFASFLLPENHLNAAARLLEEPNRKSAFVDLLREASAKENV